jgi:hypothetical protein
VEFLVTSFFYDDQESLPINAVIILDGKRRNSKQNREAKKRQVTMMHGWGFTAARQGVPQRFEEQYHCYSVAYADKPHLEVRMTEWTRTMLNSPVAAVRGATARMTLMIACVSNSTILSVFSERRQDSPPSVGL